MPSELLAGLDGDEPAGEYIEQQDREIADKSGRSTLRILGIGRRRSASDGAAPLALCEA